jgi:hypothetical protein
VPKSRISLPLARSARLFEARDSLRTELVLVLTRQRRGGNFQS